MKIEVKYRIILGIFEIISKMVPMLFPKVSLQTYFTSGEWV